MPRRLSVLMAAITILVLGAGVAYASLPSGDATSDSSTSITAPTSTTVASGATTPTLPDDDDDDDLVTSTTAPDSDDDDATTSTTVGGDDDDDTRVTSTTTSTLPDDDDDTTPTSLPAATGNMTFEATGVGTLTVAWDGGALTLVTVSPATGWTYTIDEITAREVEIDFRNAGVRHRAKVEVEHGGLRFEHFEK